MTTIANVLAKMKWQAKDTALVRRSSHLFQFCMVLLPLLTPRIAPAQESSSRTQKSGQQLMARNENGGKDVQNAVPIDPKYAIGPLTADRFFVFCWSSPAREQCGASAKAAGPCRIGTGGCSSVLVRCP